MTMATDALMRSMMKPARKKPRRKKKTTRKKVAKKRATTRGARGRGRAKKPRRLVKGTPEAKRHMAKLRRMQKRNR